MLTEHRVHAKALCTHRSNVFSPPVELSQEALPALVCPQWAEAVLVEEKGLRVTPALPVTKIQGKAMSGSL